MRHSQAAVLSYSKIILSKTGEKKMTNTLSEKCMHDGLDFMNVDYGMCPLLHKVAGMYCSSASVSETETLTQTCYTDWKLH